MMFGAGAGKHRHEPRQTLPIRWPARDRARRARRLVAQRLVRSQALARVARSVAQVGTAAEWGRRAVDAVHAATGWDRVFAFRYVGDALELVAACGTTPEQERRSAWLPLSGPSLSALAVRERRPVISGRGTVPASAEANVRRHGIGSYAVFPLIAREHVFGTLTLIDVAQRDTDDEEIEFLQAVADTLATGMESSERYTAARTATQVRDDFLSVASHELRTPLTPLKGLAQSLIRQIERARQTGAALDLDRAERYLRTMDGQVNQMTDLVNDLLDVSRIRTGRLDLRLAEVDLVAHVGAVLDRFDAMAHVVHDTQSSTEGPRGITHDLLEAAHVIRYSPEIDRLAGVWDAGRLDQVLTNLIANSLKYTPAGGEIVVHVRREEGDAGPQAHLSVEDPGIGIPAQEMADLFKPFQRLENAPAEHFSGLGLGLFIARDIVERHGGQIWAESPGTGLGTTFHVTLPLRPPPARAPDHVSGQTLDQDGNVGA